MINHKNRLVKCLDTLGIKCNKKDIEQGAGFATIRIDNVLGNPKAFIRAAYNKNCFSLYYSDGDIGDGGFNLYSYSAKDLREEMEAYIKKYVSNHEESLALAKKKASDIILLMNANR